MNFTEFENIIGYEFKNKAYLETALTHSSYANEKQLSKDCNERLEFLGDSVLGIITAEYFYHNLAHLPEGEMTKKRAACVCEKSLHGFAKEINLGDYLNLGRGEENTDCRKRPKVLADALEALIAAIYVDSGYFARHGAKDIVLKLFIDEIDAAEVLQNGDYKTMLQQLVEKDGSAILEYTVVSEAGPEHDKIFTVEARVNNNSVGVGTSHNKKDAEQQAARQALSLFGVSI